MRGHEHEVSQLALLRDNKTLVSGAKDGSVYSWDTSASRENDRSSITIPVVNWDFAPDGEAIATVDRRGQVASREGPDYQEARPFREIGGEVAEARFADHGRFLSYRLSDGSISIVDLQLNRRLQPSGKGWANFSAMTPEHHYLLYFSSNNEALERDPVTNRVVKSWHPVGGLTAYAATGDGRLRLTLGRNGIGTLTDSNRRETQVELDVPEVTYACACFSPDGRLLAVASEFGFVGLWTTEDLRPGRKLPPIARLEGFTLSPRSVAFSPDGTRLVAGGESVEAVRIFDVDTRQEVLTLTGSGQNCWDTQFSPDGNVLASHNGTGELNLWRAPTWEEIRAAEANERAGETVR